MISSSAAVSPPRRRLRAATLAIGTEVTDGQILDRNSSWISRKLVNAGIEVIEHRAVADDRETIDLALRDLSSRVDLLFVTGGLGPTSDDFTREVLSATFQLPLEFDEGSWRHIESRFAARGLTAKPIQKSQCYFPSSARVLTNPVGTANAFTFTVETSLSESIRKVTVYALPGPPAEIAAVWEKHLATSIETLIPTKEREKLTIFRTLGRGESDIAERTEAVIRGSDVKVGYRAHLPYVEVKLWSRESEGSEAIAVIKKVEEAIAPWIVGYGDDDIVDVFLDRASKGRKFRFIDRVSEGLLQERFSERLRVRKLTDGALCEFLSSGRLELETCLGPPQQDAGSSTTGVSSSQETVITFSIDQAGDKATARWLVRVENHTASETELEVRPTPLYNIGTERGRAYFVEQALHSLAAVL